MSTTLADHVSDFLSDMARIAHLGPHTLRAYRYELTAASKTLDMPLDKITLHIVEHWVARGQPAVSTVARRMATFSRFFTWAVRHQHCTPTHSLLVSQ